MRATSRQQELNGRFARQDKAQIQADIKEVMGTAAGRRLYMAMIIKGGLFELTRPTDNPSYILGRRDGAAEIYREVVTACPEMDTKAAEERRAVLAERNRQLKEAGTQA